MLPTRRVCVMAAIKSNSIYLVALCAAVFCGWSLLQGIDKQAEVSMAQAADNVAMYRQVAE